MTTTPSPDTFAVIGSAYTLLILEHSPDRIHFCSVISDRPPTPQIVEPGTISAVHAVGAEPGSMVLSILETWDRSTLEPFLDLMPEGRRKAFAEMLRLLSEKTTSVFRVLIPPSPHSSRLIEYPGAVITSMDTVEGSFCVTYPRQETRELPR